MKAKVCHVTSAHNRYDVRIFHKECKSLAANGFNVVFLVNDAKSDEVVDGVLIKSTGLSPQNRYERMVTSQSLIRKEAIKINAEIYHLHDPDLLPLALYLKRKGKKVIFDSHEDYPSTITEKRWIPRFLRPLVKLFYEWYEGYVLRKIDSAIVCYHWTLDRFSKYCPKVDMILNFPIVLDGQPYSPSLFERKICFAGGISRQWCHHSILKALLEMPDVGYELAGSLKGDYGKQLQQMDGWGQVDYHGIIPHEEVFTKVYSKSLVGMALLDYIPQCKGTIGNLSNTKLFEYMYAGLPVICTNFVLWKEIVEKENCGIVVNPHDACEISSAIGDLIENPDKAKEMGKNGHKAVLREYNWETQEAKLLDMYHSLLS